MFIVKTRRQAAEAGEKRYYTGKPCAKGHDSQRFTSTGVCIKCASGYVKEYNKRLNRETTARANGAFVHPLHADDHAAARAYCQALDMARGRVPYDPATYRPAAPVGSIKNRPTSEQANAEHNAIVRNLTSGV